jgi:LysR family hydrogen peroxide-inducible transcriptional activator
MKLQPHPLSLRQLQYVAAVAETLSFRRAAEACAVSQPALSAQVAALERALGVRLFERDRRRVLVTPAGQELLGHGRRVLREAEDLIDAARLLGDPLSGTLRLGVIPTISPYLLPEVVPALRAAHPRLSVHWIEDKTPVLVKSLGAGTLDAAVLALEADLGDLEHEPIARDAFVLATPPGHPLGKPSERPASLRELRGTSMLLLDEGHCFRDQALSFCSQAGVHEMGFRATSLSTLVQMVAGGAGVTLLPELALATELRRGGLAVRRLAAPEPHRTLALVWRRSSPLGPALRQVAATLREAAAPAQRKATPLGRRTRGA